jgi:Carboxypeptidase regulatory-like domain
MTIRSSLALLCLLSGGLLAQEPATLTGTVTDPSGAAVPNAAVKATNAATNQVRDTKTNGQGLYSIPYLDPGVYTLEVTAAGFTTSRRSEITLAVSQLLNLPVQLTIGQAATEVTVTGQQQTIDTEDADRGLVFDPLKTQDLPLNGRQSYMLLELTPGVIFGQQQFGASGFSGTRAWDVTNEYKFNGARQGNGNNVFMMNGSVISDNGSQWDFAPSVDSIQEFKAVTTTYDASLGHEAGGAVNSTIKSGTNNWHGTLYDYVRNSVLDANYFQSNVAGQAKGRLEVNQFGGTMGGPVRKDKDFMFLSYEGYQEAIPFPGAGTTTIPNDLRSGQNFSNYGITVYDPLTTIPCTTGTTGPTPCSGSQGSTYWRTPFPGNVIPTNRVSPVAEKILSYVPGPNTTGTGVGNLNNDFFNTNNEGRYWYNQPIGRWDHVIGDKDKFSVLFSEFHGFEYRSTNGFPPPVVGSGNIDNNRTFTGLNLGETHVISPNLLLDVKASYFRFVQLTPGYTEEAQSITPASVGMTGMIHAPTVDTSVIPNINIGGFASPLFGSGSYSWSPYNSWQLLPSLSWQKGRHSLRFGFEAHYEAKGNVAPGNAYGTLTFGSGLTQQASDHASTTNGGADTYLGLASFLLGVPTSGSIDNNASYYLSRPYFAGYMQDTWRATNHLTIDIGLRYEVQIPYLERYNRQAEQFNISAVNPASPQILANWAADAASYNATNPKYPYPTPPSAIYGVWQFAGQNGLPERTRYTDWTNAAPRIGFAYRLRDKTVIRGGFGVFYQSDTKNNNSQTGFSVTSPYITTFTGGQYPSACVNPLVSGNACANGTPTGPYSIVNPFPTGLAQPTGPAAGALANLGNSPNGDMLHYKIPRTYQYSLGIQRQLPGAIVLDVSFAGNYNLYTDYGQNYGNPQDAAGIALQQQAINDPTIISRQVPNPFVGVVPTNFGLGSSATVAAATLYNNYPLWDTGQNLTGGFTQNDVAGEVFRSDALQVRVEKRAFGSAGSKTGVMTFVFAYTFNKEYALLCCIGQSWQTNTAASLQLSPNGQTATLVTHPETPKQNLSYQFDSANQPQDFAFNGVWDLPIGKGRSYLNGVTGVADKIASGWRFDYILTYISGNPVSLPQAINFCGQYTNYVDPTTGATLPQSNAHWFNNNPKCYQAFPTNAINTALPPRFSGNVEQPTAPQLSIALTKTTTIKEHYNLTFRAESFNVTNTPILGNVQSTTFTSATFGVIPNSQNNFPRNVQLALKLQF